MPYRMPRIGGGINGGQVHSLVLVGEYDSINYSTVYTVQQTHHSGHF